VRVLRAGLPCEPCWTGARLRSCANRVDCLRTLDVDSVAAEVRRLIGDAAACAPPAATAPPPAPAAASVPAPRLADVGAPLVSCLMPTRDRRAFVPRAIAQFLAQDYPHRELLVLDDGGEPVADLVPADPRIRYARIEPGRTLGAKRNLACTLVAGELLAHWDDDDWMAPWRLSYQVAALRDAPGADACGLSTLRFFDPARGRAWEYRYPARGRPWVAGGTLLFRRGLWERHPFPDLREGEDTRFVWSLPGRALLRLTRPDFYAALVHGGNTSRKRTTGANWHAVPLDTVRSAMGPDWEFYAGLGAAGGS
jgi:antitoxin (DNA-binding transcriptional repressor) of toxin-antitoxin stability system